MKALEVLKELKESRDFDGNIEYKIDAAIKDLDSLALYIKSLEEYRSLVRHYLQIEKCSCGTLKVKGYLCSNKRCTEE